MIGIAVAFAAGALVLGTGKGRATLAKLLTVAVVLLAVVGGIGVLLAFVH